MLKYFFLQVQNSDWLDEHGQTIGTIVIILLFALERWLAFREKNVDRRENWYHSVVIQPNLERINNFFEEYSQSALSAAQNITNSLISANPSTLLQVKAAFFNQLTIAIQKFDFDFLMIIYGYDIRRHSILLQTLNNMHDEAVRALDNDTPNSNNILLEIKNQKAIFYNNLYQPLR